MSLHNLKPSFACSKLTILHTGSIRVSLSMSGINSFCMIQRRHLFGFFGACLSHFLLLRFPRQQCHMTTHFEFGQSTGFLDNEH